MLGGFIYPSCYSNYIQEKKMGNKSAVSKMQVLLGLMITYKSGPSEIITFLPCCIFTPTDLNILNIVSKPSWPSPNWTRQTRERATVHLYLGERGNVHTDSTVGNEISSASTSNLWLWGARLSGLLTEFKPGSVGFSISLYLRGDLLCPHGWCHFLSQP